MIPTKLETIVKAVRLRYAIPFVALLVAVYWMGFEPAIRIFLQAQFGDRSI